MPEVTPASLADFLQALPISAIEFHLPEIVEIAETAGGEVLPSNIGTRLWNGRVTLGRLTRSETLSAQVLIDDMRGAGKFFMASHITHPFPQTDPQGIDIQTANVLLASLPNDANTIALAGLRPNYVLTRGDYLSFTYRSNPTRYALHRVVTTSVQADNDGLSPVFKVQPPVRPGAQIGTPVTLANAACKALIRPGSVEAGRTSRFTTEGIAFDFQQTLR